MPLRMWVSNNPVLNRIIGLDFPDYEVPKSTQVLGLHWDVQNDTLNITPPTFVGHGSLSKRKLLSLVSSMFDPLGLLSPITIRGKLLVRDSWRLKIGWDEMLPPSFVENWSKLADDYRRLEEIKVPRMVAQRSDVHQLHVFCDASSIAYGAVAYLVSEETSHMITSKARVAPMKTRTLPQMELTALQVGTRLAKHIQDTLTVQINNTIIWSDNEASLQWVRNDKSNVPYVKNRVADIRDLGSSSQFKHVPSKENPADFLSRGVSLGAFHDCDLWFSGPSWLCYPDNWPQQKEEVISVCTSMTRTRSAPPAIFDVSKISSLRKILHITEYVFKFLKMLKPSLKLPSSIQYWVKFSQLEHYSEEYHHLESKENPSGKTLSLIKNLGLYIDSNTRLISCRGRLHYSGLIPQAKFPILLPRHSWLTTLLIRDYHNKGLHGGVADTLGLLREQYWIPKGRQVVKTVLKGCVICKTIEGQPFKFPGPPPLPKERVVHLEPFHTVGVDYSGPIVVSKTDDGVPSKCYICLFTCASTRAIHLELAKDLTALTFLNLLRRFIARRSSPGIIISDNATNFTATSKFLQELYKDPLVKTHLQHTGITWKFIPPGAPWMGGFYERLIGSVKTCIRKVLFRRKISEEELITILAEVEMRINNRPITYIDDDINNPTPLTPSHLIYGKRLHPMPIEHEDYTEDPNDPDYIGTSELNNRYVYLSKLLKHWELVWNRDYLTSLREKHYGAQATKQRVDLKIGDVVLVQCEGPRASWPLGRITALHRDKEDTVRIAEVYSKGICSKRTIEKLVPLEIHAPIAPHDSGDVQQTAHSTNRPQRQAARKAEAAICDILNANLL